MEGKTYQHYQKLYNLIRNQEFHLLEKLFLRSEDFSYKFFKNKICLDAGCGFGRVVKVISTTAKTVVGVDITIEKAKKFLEKSGRNNIFLINGSLLFLPFKSNVFDFISSIGVLHHIPHPYEGLEEIWRCLKPDGIIHLEVYGEGGIFSGFIAFLRRIAKYIPFSLSLSLIYAIMGSRIRTGLALDYMYVPIIKRFTEDEIERYLYHLGAKEVKRINQGSYIGFNKKGSRFRKILFGEGWIIIRAKK